MIHKGVEFSQEQQQTPQPCPLPGQAERGSHIWEVGMAQPSLAAREKGRVCVRVCVCVLCV